jgi:hypothetical protein
MWDKAKIHALLDEKPKAVERAIVAIYNRQTASEKNALATTDSNGIGFAANDAEFLSSLAEWINKGRSLSAKQLAIGRNRIKRYHRQLCEIANEKEVTPLIVSPSIESAVANHDEAMMVENEIAIKEGKRRRELALSEEQVQDLEDEMDAALAHQEALEEQRRMEYKFGRFADFS